jgi:hypothetical protein
MVPVAIPLFEAYLVQNEIRRQNKVCLDFLRLHIQSFTDIFVSNAAMAEIPASSQKADKSAETEEVGVPEKEPSESPNLPLAVDKVKTTGMGGCGCRCCRTVLLLLPGRTVA